jgi:levansucrase
MNVRHRAPRAFAMLVSVLLLGGVGLLAPSAIAAPRAASDSTTATAAAGPFRPRGTFTDTWTRADALKVRSDPTNTSPAIPLNFPIMTNQVWVWDTWPLTNLNTDVVTFRGWHVIFSLTAPRNVPFNDRHSIARIGFFYSRDAKSWIYGGPLFREGDAFGIRQWAGSAILRGGNLVQTFYTASGHDNAPPPAPNDVLQRIATATGRIHANSERVWFTGFHDHSIVAQADGRLYQTLEQSQGAPIIYAFRDPFIFRNPADRKVYILFEGNTPGQAGSYRCQPRDIGPVPPGHVVPPDANLYTGNIGLAEVTSANLRRVRLLHPLLAANCVNQQLERPHFVFHQNRVYLFTISHKFTYAPGLTGPDGVYGFVGRAIRDDYQPLNGSALVLGNPAEQPNQQYSHYVMPNLLVESFIDTFQTPAGPVSGGTLAPTLQMAIERANTYVVGVLDYGFIPATRSRPR